MLLYLFMLALPLVANGVTLQGRFQCPPEQVLGFVKQDDDEIDMNAITPPLCGQTRTCIYTRGPCMFKGQYVSSVTADAEGNVLIECCSYSPPVQEHESDDCHELAITDDLRSQITTKAGQPGGAPTPTTPRHGGPPTTTQKSTPKVGKREVNGAPGSIGGKVGVEVFDLPPGQPAQLVKAITKIKDGYTVTVCTPKCRGSSTTRRPSTSRPTTDRPRSHEKSHEKPKSPEKPPPPPADRPKKSLGLLNGQHCFSGDMLVTTPVGTKRMDQLRAGDMVQVSASDSKPMFEPVEWLYHRDHAAIADFITITTKSQQILRLSSNHLIPIVPCSDIPLRPGSIDRLTASHSYFASRLRVGQCILSLKNDTFRAEEVSRIAVETKSGIYSPITSHGTIVVNGVYASCYSSFENHLAQKTIHSALIKARRLVSPVWNTVFGSSLSLEDSFVPVPLQMLLSMAKVIVPSNVF